MKHLYQKFLKEGNGDHKYLRCPDPQDNNFEVLCSAILLDEIYIDCEETVTDKPTGNGLGFITYSNTINVSGKLLDNSGYLITQWIFFAK